MVNTPLEGVAVTTEHIYCLYIVDIYTNLYMLFALALTQNTLEKSIKISKNTSETHLEFKAAFSIHVLKKKIKWWPRVQNYSSQEAVMFAAFESCRYQN